MLARIANNLRWRVKTHRLGIEQSAGKGRRKMAFEPARHIDQMGKACRMAFRETIFAKALDLIEAARCKFGVIAARHHSPDHHILQFIHHAARTECRHGLAQAIGLGTREFRSIKRDLHRLLLKNRHTQSAL